MMERVGQINLILGIMLFYIWLVPLNATTYYVALWGNDNWPGTSPDSAWRHIAYTTQRVKAGDSVLVFSGIYEDEHAVFANTGNPGSPIVLTAYSDSFVMDGIDSTGIAIRMVDKSYISLSGFRIKNYGTGVRGEGLLTNLEISDFTIEGIDGDGVDFDGASLQNSTITDFTIRNTNGIAVTHFDYSSTDCHDVEISHFLIRDINNEGINWRNSRRVHIHHGEIYNTASDGIHLQLSVDSSVIEYVRVDTTGWHGIAIHDHTVGSYPCSSNVIKYCYVANSGHNDIDLHSGAFNTVIEACTLGGPLTVGQAIYFHNLGSGLIVRNCIIRDVPGEGIDGGPSSGQYLRDILIENNLFYNLNCGIMFQGSTEDITIRQNRIYDTPYDIHVGAYNILIDSNYTENGYYRINGHDGRIFDALDTTYHARSAYGALVTVGYTDGRVFEQGNTGGYGPYFINKPYWYPHGSYFTMKADSFWCDVDIYTYQMTVIPSSDSVEVFIYGWDTTGIYYKKWGELSSTPTITTSHSVGDFPPFSLVRVRVDGNLYGDYNADPFGWITFDYEGGFPPDTLIFEAYVVIVGIEEEITQKPKASILYLPHPNPFNSAIQIRYVLQKESPVELVIYNTLGEKIRTLVKDKQKAGYHKICWDGTDDSGKRVASGVYFCRLKVGNFSQIRKLLFLR